MSIASAAKQGIKLACVASGSVRLMHRLSPAAVVIFRYHSVQDEPGKFATTIGCESIHASPVFRRHMELLARRFIPVSLDDVLSFLRGATTLPARAVAVTFDDGYKDNSEIAAPILNHFGIPATFYVLADSVDRSRAPWFCRLQHIFLTSRRRSWNDPTSGVVHELTNAKDRSDVMLAAACYCAKSSDSMRGQYIRAAENALDPEPFPAESELMMTWDDVRGLARSGHTVGAHTMTHPNLAHVSTEDARYELGESKRILEKKLGQNVRHFSYPCPALDPHWNENTVKLTAEVGYSTAVTTHSSAAWRGTNPLIIPRTYVPREEYEFLWNTERTFLMRSRFSSPDQEARQVAIAAKG